MLYYFKKGKNITEMQKKICAVYGEGAVTAQICQKYSVKFYAGDFSLDNAPQSGGPVEVDSHQIKELTGNNQPSTTWEIANTLKISKLIKLLVKVKNVSYILLEKLNRFFGQPNIKSFRNQYIEDNTSEAKWAKT